MTSDSLVREARPTGTDERAAELLFKEARRRRRHRRVAFGAVVLTVLVAIAALVAWAAGDQAANRARGGAPDISEGSFGPGPYAYVTNQHGGITAINLDTHRVSASLRVAENPFCRSLRTGDVPRGLRKEFASGCRGGIHVGNGLAVDPRGRTAYMTSSEGILRIDLADGHVGRPLPHTKDLQSLALAPDGDSAYATIAGGGELVEIDLASGGVERRFALPPGAADVAVPGDGRTAWLTNGLSFEIYPLDLTNGTLGAPIPVPGGAISIAVSRNGRFALVTDTGNPAALVKKTGKWRLEQKYTGYSYVTPVDLATRTVGTPITLYHAPDDVAIAPDGETAYVTTGGHGPPGPPGILVVDLARGVESGSIRVAAGAWLIAIP